VGVLQKCRRRVVPSCYQMFRAAAWPASVPPTSLPAFGTCLLAATRCVYCLAAQKRGKLISIMIMLCIPIMCPWTFKDGVGRVASSRERRRDGSVCSKRGRWSAAPALTYSESVAAVFRRRGVQSDLTTVQSGTCVWIVNLEQERAAVHSVHNTSAWPSERKLLYRCPCEPPPPGHTTAATHGANRTWSCI
jgi:hypothetical protein